MKISYSWLKHWIDTPLSIEDISKILTDTGLEVEGVTTTLKVQGGMEGLVVGEVLTCEQHSNADRLKVTTVNLGKGNPLQIVCGASNVDSGQKVIVATIGTKLYPSEGKPLKIKKGKIRGEVSMGMICAEDEIGLGKGHDGIMVLDENAVPGTPAVDYFGLEPEQCMEIGLTPNRTDAMSHWGVARDLHAALQHLKTAPSKLSKVDYDQLEGDKESPINVQVDSADDCPVYLGWFIPNVEVKDSPDWLKEKLMSIGLTPKNNVVDITNFVLHDLGQPLHAFDADIIKGNVRIGSLPEGTEFTTLDGTERKLNADDLMICDDDGALCIAGVFGGENSGVSEKTKNVFLESAWFNPLRVRNTAKRHGLNTDASFRFERGVDPDISEAAIMRAAKMIEELAGGDLSHAIAKAKNTDKLPQTAQIDLRWKEVERLTGIAISQNDCLSILNSLDFEVAENSNEQVTLKVPRYRSDVTRPADVIEEILRIYGFNQVPVPRYLKAALSHKTRPNKEEYREKISQALTSRGAMEMMSNSLTSSSYISLMPNPEISEKQAVRMLNPLSSDLEIMRQTLLFQALEAISRNRNHKNPDLFMYEFGKVYHKRENGYSENEHLSIFVTGKVAPSNWNTVEEAANFSLPKSSTLMIFQLLGWANDIKQKPAEIAFCSNAIQFVFKKKKLGSMGLVDPTILKRFKINVPVWWVNLDWDQMFSMISAKHLKAQDMAKFPAVRRDLSLLIDSTTTFSELKNTAYQVERKLLKDVGLFDVYEGDKIEAGKKSYALSFTLQDADSTMKDAMIDKTMERITNALIKNHSAVLR